MRNVYKINQFETVHNECHFILNETKQLIQIQTTGQLIVDTDNEAFIYIIEEDNAYSYVQFPKEIWPQLLHLVLVRKNPFLRVQDGQIELNNFVDELIALLFNIEGNGNYGESFMTSVEHVFADFFVQNEV